MDGTRGEKELLSVAYANTLKFYKQIPEARSIAFVSMGTGIYKWPLELAAEIAVNELVKSQFERTTMCVIDKAAQLVYQSMLATME
jgi:O-acetyl-ADP-ribose deacetylase (regulator of RNase III)